jgi:hypothetical protein
VAGLRARLNWLATIAAITSMINIRGTIHMRNMTSSFLDKEQAYHPKVKVLFVLDEYLINAWIYSSQRLIS